jgi:hypothetical protein
MVDLRFGRSLRPRQKPDLIAADTSAAVADGLRIGERNRSSLFLSFSTNPSHKHVRAKADKSEVERESERGKPCPRPGNLRRRIRWRPQRRHAREPCRSSTRARPLTPQIRLGTVQCPKYLRRCVMCLASSIYQSVLV